VNPAFLVSNSNALADKRLGRCEFPHMSVYDCAVWRCFLATGFAEFDSIEYDVTVGGKSARHVRREGDLVEMWERLLRKRIDVVGFRAVDTWITEVKPLASMSALGQVLSYERLYLAEHPDTKNPRKVVVCARVDEDVEESFNYFGVSLVVVNSDSPDAAPSVLQVLGPLGT